MNYIDNEEWLPLVNESGEIIGKELRSVCHSGTKLLHPVIHLHVLNKEGEIFLQKRPLNKKIQPGKWDTAVGGHIAFSESIQTSLQREALEEIGLEEFDPVLVSEYIWETEIEKEYIYSFTTEFDGKLKINTDELADGRFWTKEEIIANLGKDVFTPNFEVEFRKIFLH